MCRLSPTPSGPPTLWVRPCGIRSRWRSERAEGTSMSPACPTSWPNSTALRLCLTRHPQRHPITPPEMRPAGRDGYGAARISAGGEGTQRAALDDRAAADHFQRRALAPGAECPGPGRRVVIAALLSDLEDADFHWQALGQDHGGVQRDH